MTSDSDQKNQKGLEEYPCLDTVVAIREEYLKDLPFGELKSRHGLALMWSYLGDRFLVGHLMQTLCHRSRAYYVQANQLRGFLVPFKPWQLEFAELVKRIPKAEFQRIFKYQHANRKDIIDKLEAIQSATPE